MIWYLAFGLAAWMTASLLFTLLYAWAGYRWQKRKEIKREYDWHMSPIYLHEPLDVIRAKDLI